MSGRYLEDFAIGDVIEANEEYEVTPERLAAFAGEYDPQPIHLDPVAAGAEMFGGIVASGWHSAAATMQLLVRARLIGGGPIVGIAIDNLRFLQPVRAGDRLRARAQVLETRESGTRPGRGFLMLRITTSRQDGVAVLTQDWTLLVPRRAA